MEEIWKDIKGYQVSNRGQVRSLDRWILDTKGRRYFVKGRILKQCLDGHGYPMVNLYYNGKTNTERVHQLVWEAFNGKVPKGMEINHISEDKTDNRICNLNLLNHKANLNWGTRNERSAKSRRNNPKRSKPIIQKSLQGEIIKIWPSLMEIHRELGYSYGNISQCCNGKFKQRYGYIWKYVER